MAGLVKQGVWEARKAATASRDMSRDAEAALALAIAPTLTHAESSRTFDDDETLSRTIDLAFGTEHPATDVFLRVKYRDGRTESFTCPTLGGTVWRITLQRTWRGEPDFNETAETAQLIYRDKRGIAQYQLDGGFGSLGRGDDRHENSRPNLNFHGPARVIAPPHLRTT